MYEVVKNNSNNSPSIFSNDFRRLVTKLLAKDVTKKGNNVQYLKI